jgi:hypothetical protein
MYVQVVVVMIYVGGCYQLIKNAGVLIAEELTEKPERLVRGSSILWNLRT